MILRDKGEVGILNFVTTHFKNSIKAVLHVYFVNVLFIYISMFDLMLILLENNLNGNNKNFRTADLV